MAPGSPRARSLADQVFDQLITELIAERYAPDSALPSERELVERCGVARHVVREAIKRIEQLGLVRTTPGGATRVLDFKRNAGLDLLALLAEHTQGGEDALYYARAVLEMRAAIGADIARLCAQRGAPALREGLVAIANAMKQAGDDAQLFELELQFWDRLLEGAENIAYRLALNSLLKGTALVGEIARGLFVIEIRLTGYRLPIAEAVRAGDAEQAERLTRDALERSVRLAEAAKPAPPAPPATPVRTPTRKTRR